MRRYFDILKTMTLVLCAALAIGCQKDKYGDSDMGRKAMVTLEISSGHMTKATEEATDQEKLIRSVRVYAFSGTKMVGHYFRENPTPSTEFSLVMDIEFLQIDNPETQSQNVDFYVVANEAAMTLASGSSPLAETTKEAELWQMKYTALDKSKGLPMYYAGTHLVTLDIEEDLDPQPTTDMTGHEDHVISQKLDFTLTRPMAKVEFYAAKEASINTLDFKSITFSNPATLGYLLPQASLSGVTLGTSPLQLVASSVSVTKDINPATANLSDHLNYQKVGEAAYIFENPYGSDIWNVQKDVRGSVLTVVYDKEGSEETGIVYMPAIERNTAYKICCLVRSVRDVVIRFEVSEWASETVNVPEYN